MAKDATDKTGSSKEAYDDRPFHFDNLPPEIRAPLAPYAGAEPPTPAWFRWAIAQEPERGFVTSHGTKIETLTWGEPGKPGLLLAHGNSAHADWWSPLAPYLAKDYRVTSMSLAGMGNSEWRETYRFRDFADDAEAVSRATGLYDGGRKPIYIGHSFGGGQVFFAAAKYPEHMHAAVLVDTGFGGPPPEVLEAQAKRREVLANIPSADRPSRVYATVEQALARFRLMPPQPTENHYVLDFIARRSLKRAPLPDGSGEGWTWKFDPEMWEKLDRSEGMSQTVMPRLAVPMVHLYGDKSRIIERKAKGEQSFFDDQVMEIEIPNSHHHVMIDQPLALVAALRTLLATWPH
ncbi:MAG: alpha/beta hydrolase [Alphaproteobacteria bacterium]|nr:alpha/beta hydrolase [Alphaproteobacteria bacterium]MBU1516229.1 alpha/beta hydrolase [Alphaproteobacteria bacterium]MBU2095766.1 alpha/beta hydrolase [Alphaproteobacteria bacterium]MBU2151983.1 alpha/beta hydrolase [Alphaproteobacteria bacterium]MBU2306835.1 alpha/beta hydrolase [Alphaproteobacteria bacterium]